MNIGIIINDIKLEKAIQRYIKFIHSLRSTAVKMDEIDSFADVTSEFDCFIIDVFGIKDDKYLSLGPQYGVILEGDQKKLIYFFTTYTLLDNYTLDDLPDNCFYLPKQLDSFLNALSFPTERIESSVLLQNMFRSSTLTTASH